ncbi:MAG: AAA-associated domain-containing protein [Thermoprotei archaeon]
MSKSGDSQQHVKFPFMPLGIKIESVFGLLKALDVVFNRHADLYKLAEYFDLEIDDLIPVLEVAEMLGFAVIDGGDIFLTESGELFIRAPVQSRRSILRERIKNFEPFKSALSLINNQGSFKIEDLINLLSNLGYSEIGEIGFHDKLAQTLIDWGLYSGLFSYSSEDNIFKKSKRKV